MRYPYCCPPSPPPVATACRPCPRSFGALLLHMAVGTPPHRGLHPAQILVGLLTGDLDLSTAAWPEHTPPAVRALGVACLQRDPERRPTFDVIVRAIMAAIKEQQQQMQAQLPPMARAAASMRRSGAPTTGTLPQAHGAAPPHSISSLN